MNDSIRQWTLLRITVLITVGIFVFSPLTILRGDEIQSLRIDTAKWESGDNRLIVKGRGPRGQEVTIRNVDTQSILGTIRIRTSEWKLELRNPSPVPCRVSAEAQSHIQERAVEKAPTDCGGLTNLPPDSTISPSSNLTVSLGEAIEFSSQGSDPDGNLPLTYTWTFGGGAPNSTEQNPGSVIFSQIGTFTVQLQVTDSLGLADPTPATIVVTVTSTGNIGSVPQQPFTLTGQYQVLPSNDLGMHCGDLGNSAFSMLPPFNRVLAQVIQKGGTGSNRPRILDNTQVSVEYSATSNPVDPNGANSINSTSQNSDSVYKTDFWDIHPITGNPIVQDLFGLNPPADEGLAFGQKMPGNLDPYRANDPQRFNSFLDVMKAFVAPGIPVTPTDDIGRHNSYPLMRIQAKDGAGNILATTDTVVPVSEEVNCAGCHALEGENPIATERQGVSYVAASSQTLFNIEHAGKINILRLHDAKHGTTLDQQQPVLCARCHYSAALDLAEQGAQGEQIGHEPMSKVLHKLHGGPHPLRPFDIPEIIPSSGSMEKNCFQCHPGKITQCFRGAMFTAGLQCHDCHTSMNAVAGIFPLKTGDFRRHWLDEPKCGSCHGGDALDHLGPEIILRKAFDPTDPAGTPLIPTNTRFAENPDTLYRNSKGHGGVFCEGCHGSPHAIWPNQNPQANDNIAANQLQGHSGPIHECSTCHTDGSLGLTLNGPHGMHPVNDRLWNKEHKELFENNPSRCQTCHGVNLEGTVLSKTAADRTLQAKEEQPDGSKNIFLPKGTQVSCTLCHKFPEAD